MSQSTKLENISLKRKRQNAERQNRMKPPLKGPPFKKAEEVNCFERFGKNRVRFVYILHLTREKRGEK